MKTVKTIAVYLLLLLTFAVSSCKDDESLGDQPRLFSPTILNLSVVGGIGYCDATIKWDRMPYADSYTIELSADSMKFESIVERFVTPTNSYTFANLERGKLFSVRVRTNSKDLEHDSHYASGYFKTPTESIYLPAQPGDIKTTSLTVRFPAGVKATHLFAGIYVPGGTVVNRIPLSENDIEAGMYKITGLKGDTEYLISICYNDIIRDTKRQKTAYLPSGDNVVYLTEDADLRLAMQDPENIGKILILPEGYTFTTTSNTAIAGAMTIYGNPDGLRAKITPNQFILPTAAAGTISFVYCDIDRGAGDGKGTTGTYMYNLNAAFGTVSKLLYDNCRLANFGRGFMRVQGSAAGVVDSVVFNNCEIKNMGVANADYGFFHLDVANVAVSNIVMKNSTFDGVGCHFIYVGQNRTIGTKSVNIENCTFYRMMSGSAARWFINLGNVNNPENSKITLKNLILGSTEQLPNAQQVIPVHNGIKRDNVTFDIQNVYQTNDWITATATEIEGTTKYSKGAADLFVDPANGVFNIKDNSFAGKGTAGDPRW